MDDPTTNNPTAASGDGQLPADADSKDRQLEASRVDIEGTYLTTDQGVRVDHTDDSLTRRRARSDAAGGLPPPGEDHPLRPRADPGAGGARPRRRGVRLLRGVRVDGRRHRRRLPGRARPAYAGVRAVLHRRRLARVGRHRARRARLRDEVLHQAGQLRPRRQQHAGVLHPGRHQVPRLRARGEARAAQRDPAGPVRARHVLGLRPAAAGDAAHDDVADVGPRDPAQLPDDAGLRRPHVPVRQRPRDAARS